MAEWLTERVKATVPGQRFKSVGWLRLGQGRLVLQADDGSVIWDIPTAEITALTLRESDGGVVVEWREHAYDLRFLHDGTPLVDTRTAIDMYERKPIKVAIERIEQLAMKWYLALDDATGRRQA